MGSFMSCVLICGAVEVVQVLHSDGHVERLIRPVQHTKPSGSYLLLPVQQAKGGASENESYKYRRLTSLRFYKSASSPSQQQEAQDKKANLKGDAGHEASLDKGSRPNKKKQHLSSQEWTQLLLDSSSCSSSSSSQPFKVKREGGVTKLVVSKKYLSHLLSQQASQTSSSGTTSKAEQPVVVPSPTRHQHCSSRIENKRPSVWRPALESISEAQLHDR